MGMVTKRVEPVGSRRGGALLVPLEDETSLVLLAGAGVGMPEAVDLPCQEALRLRNNRSLTEHWCCVKHLGIDSAGG